MSDGVHPAAIDTRLLIEQCEIRRGRRSGPGGQHRNKVETAIVIVHEPTGTRAEATERRSQAENRRVAISRLRVNLALEVRSTGSSGDLPSDLWRTRCVGGKIKVSPTHVDFPSILAEALDQVAASNFDVAAAAVSLGCSTSQLIKLLKVDPRALRFVNEQRQERQFSRLQ